MKKLLAFLTVVMLLASLPAKATDVTFPNFVTGATAQQNISGSEALPGVASGTTMQFSSVGVAHAGEVVVTEPPYNASGFVVKTLTTSALGAGTTNIPVTSSANFAVGDVVGIGLAGNAGGTKHLYAFISAIPDATHITLSATAVSGASLPSNGLGSTTGTVFTGFSGTAITTLPIGTLVWSYNSTTASSAANGATTITVANTASYRLGQGMLISTGGASAVDLIVTITNVSGTTSGTISFTPAISNASGIAANTNIQHDDSAAIQLAMTNNVSVTQSASIFFPDGVYQVNKAPSGTGNTALIVPDVPYYSGCCANPGTDWQPQATLQMYGRYPAPETQSYIANNQTAHQSGVIILTRRVPASVYSIIGSYSNNSNFGTSLNHMSNIQFSVANMTFRTYPNPWVGAVDCSYMQSCSGYNVNIDTDETAATTQPTHTSQKAWIGPPGQSGGQSELSRMQIVGQYVDMQIGEHSIMHHMRFEASVTCLLAGQTGNNNYAFEGYDVQCNGANYALRVGSNGGNPQGIFMPMYNIEHTSTPSWANVVKDIDDPNNTLVGFIGVDSPTWQGSTFSLTGGANVTIVQKSCPSFPAFGCATAATLSTVGGTGNGAMKYCSDCTIASPCAGSGTGALAKRLNGAWVCN